ncbi:MAG: TolC family protein [Planctomycetes bacterium]|nr:TolC family protein [Planctomycetota bacterium]
MDGVIAGTVVALMTTWGLPQDAAIEGAKTTESTKTVELSLDDCVREVLRGNLSLKLAEIDRAARVASVTEALGAFDPELYANLNSANGDEPTASSFQAPSNQSMSGGGGLRGLLRNGLSYDLGYALSYNRQSPSNSFFDFNPTLSSDLALNLTQPLLRGFGETVTEAPVEQARLFVERDDADFFARVQETTFLAVQAYWQLVRARRERDTAQSALAVAEELVRNNQKRLDAGVMTRLDVLTAQAEAARRRETLIRSGNGVSRAEDAVKSLMSPGADPAAWRGELVPTSEPQLRAEPLPSEEDVVEAAFASRSDLRALEVDLRAADLDLEVAENGQRSRLDLVGSYSYAGLAGKQAGGSSKNNIDLAGESLAQIRDREFDRWSLGFDFSRPIGNRTADAGMRRSELAKERAVMALLERRMLIVEELRRTIRDVADAGAAFEAAKQARLLAEEQYQAELVRLENEHSTTFQVREVQRDLFEALDREGAAITAYETSYAALDKARGELAQKYGVRWSARAPAEGTIRE